MELILPFQSPPQSSAFSTLCGPMGYGTQPSALARMNTTFFQYPLRAYGLWNPPVARPALDRTGFQYPLRAYGLWNLANRRTSWQSAHLSVPSAGLWACLLYTSDAADDQLCVDLGGRRIIKTKK